MDRTVGEGVRCLSVDGVEDLMRVEKGRVGVGGLEWRWKRRIEHYVAFPHAPLTRQIRSHVTMA